VTGLKEIQTDVLVIGSGVAGVMAALKAASMGCSVALASKVSMRSGNSANSPEGRGHGTGIEGDGDITGAKGKNA